MTSPARAAQPVQYVRVCSLYGAGFYYIPGTDTCLKLGGYTEVGEGKVYLAARRYTFVPDGRQVTEYGTVRTYVTACPTSSGASYVSGGATCPSGSSYGWAVTAGLKWDIGLIAGYGTSSNSYGDIPSISSDGALGGGHAGFRHYFQSNGRYSLFWGLDAGAFAANINGRNEDGAFVKYDWAAWQGAQFGVTVNPQPGGRPLTFHGDIAFAEGGVRVGVETRFVQESMSGTLTGFAAGGGVEVDITPNIAAGVTYKYFDVRGTIVDDRVSAKLHTWAATLDYKF